jgi:MFS family permease
VKVPWASASPLVAAVLWTIALTVDPGPLAPWSVFLVGFGLMTTATVAVVGMIIVAGRWARRTGLASILAGLLIAVARPVDTLWVAAVVVSVLAWVVLFLPSVNERIRKLPSASGPPPRAVLVPLVLVATPFTVGLAAWDRPTVATVIVGLSAPLAALWYSRVLPGGLYAVRIIWPLLALALAPLQPLPAAVVSALTALVVVVLAWGRQVEIAFHPRREKGQVFPIPPELAPKEILDAAQIDERGRPR